MSKKVIQKKLFLLLTAMGILPVIIIIAFISLRMSGEMERAALEQTQLKSTMVSEHLTAVDDRNFFALHALATTPFIKQYVQNPTPELEQLVRSTLSDTNQLFKDQSLIAITDARGQQLVRTDGAPLVNIASRQHFKEAMAGRDHVSDIMVSMSTGEIITVLEVPIFDQHQKPIGMLQRNYSLSAIQDFVKRHAEDMTSIVILDRESQVVAHSDYNMFSSEDMKEARDFSALAPSLSASQGSDRLMANGEDCLVSYTRNGPTGWTIVTVMPYHYLSDQIRRQVLSMVVVGLLVMLLVSIVSYPLSRRALRPIHDIYNTLKKIANGHKKIDKIHVYDNDEIGEMALALNEMHRAQEMLQKAAERDPVTDLFSRGAMEEICRQKLQQYQREAHPGYLAMYLIDLDHFQAVCQQVGSQHHDRLLSTFGTALSQVFRNSDAVGRIEGDCFMVVLDELKDTSIIEKKGLAILMAARDLRLEGRHLGLTASIGIALVPQNGKTFQIIYHAAKQALYQAKKDGGNSFRVAEDKD